MLLSSLDTDLTFGFTRSIISSFSQELVLVSEYLCWWIPSSLSIVDQIYSLSIITIPSNTAFSVWLSAQVLLSCPQQDKTNFSSWKKMHYFSIKFVKEIAVSFHSVSFLFAVMLHTIISVLWAWHPTYVQLFLEDRDYSFVSWLPWPG